MNEHQHPTQPHREQFVYTAPLLNQLRASQPVSVQRRPWALIVLRELLHVGFIVAIMYVLINLLVPRFLVEGTSMEPTFHNRERVVVSRIDYMLGRPQRGDVIVFNHAEDTYLIKRIVGLPGESIVLKDGKVFINDIWLEETYTEGVCVSRSCKDTTWLLGEDEYFVLGDNRSSSMDSHNFGPIKMSQIVGKVRMRYWPLDQFVWISG
ncbi:MAG: signal peptidase I [Chloroflexi bacterium]|nr:signal peptidase I [Chloroflexota bacterium]